MTRGEVDRALAELDAGYGRITGHLYTVDGHPAHGYLRDTPLTGATADLWRNTRPHVDALWTRFAELRDILDRARTVRDTRWWPDRSQLAELTELLRDATVPATMFAERLEGACRDVLAIFTTVADRLTTAIDRLAALDGALGAARARAAALGLGGTGELSGLAGTVDRLAGELAEVRDASVGDPVGTDPEAPRMRAVADAIAAVTANLAELERFRAGYPARCAALRLALDAIATTERAAGEAYALATAKIADPRLPPAATEEHALRERLHEADRLGSAGRWPLLREVLPDLEAAVATAGAAVEERRAFAAGLLARREELRGRLEAYRIKAVRLGRGEDTELFEGYRHARALLWSAPCDLPAATLAVAAYQRSLLEGEAA